MKVITQEWKSRNTGLVGRIRHAIKCKHKQIELKTPVDVYGYVNLRPCLTSAGMNTVMRRRGKKVVVLIDPSGADKVAKSARKYSPELRKALINLPKQKDACLLITTALETYHYTNMRGYLRDYYGVQLKTARNCQNVMVWRTA